MLFENLNLKFLLKNYLTKYVFDFCYPSND